jgi:hypothetical protein
MLTYKNPNQFLIFIFLSLANLGKDTNKIVYVYYLGVKLYL